MPEKRESSLWSWQDGYYVEDSSEKLGDIKVYDINGRISDQTLKEKYQFQQSVAQYIKEHPSKKK